MNGGKNLAVKTNLTMQVDKVRTPWGAEVTVTGRLTDINGNPIPNAPIEVLLNGRVIKTVKTDRSGNYIAKIRLTMPPGKATIQTRFRGGFF